MATYTVKAPDGKTVTLQGPDGASQADIIAQAQKLYKPAAAPAPKPAPVAGQRNITVHLPGGKTHVYENVDPNITKGQMASMIERDFPGQRMADAPKPAPPTRDQRITAAGRNLGSRGKSDLASGVTGAIRRNLFFSLPEHLAAAGERFLPTALTGNGTDASYSDILKMVRARDDAQMDRSATGNVIGTIIGGLATGRAAGGAISAVGTRAAAAASPIVARAGNVLQSLSTMQKGQKVANAARIVTAGAAAGGAQAAGEGSNVGKGAAYGAGGAAALGSGFKAAQVISRPFRDVLRLSNAGQILSRLTTATSDQLTARGNAYRQATGAEPTLFELLPLADRNKILTQAVVGRDNVVEAASGAIRRRANNLGPEMSAQARRVLQPNRDRIHAQLLDDIEQARGGTLHPDDHDLVARAMESPTDMSEFRDREARAIMAPHDDTPVAESFNEILPPPVPHNVNGSITEVDSDPAVTAVIRSAAPGGFRAATSGEAPVQNVTAGDISSMIESLRGDLPKGGIEARTAQRAIDHLQGVLGDRAPEAAAAHAHMTDAYAARSRMMEGMHEGAATRLRDDVQVGTSRRQARTVRNAYDSPEGTAGRTLGQGNKVLVNLEGSPEEALRSTVGMSRNSTGRQLSQNVGLDPANQLAAAARAQDESAQALAAASNKVQGGHGESADAETLVQAIVGLHPSSFMTTKAGAVRKLLDMTYIPENRARTIVDMIFSQDPAMVRRAIDAVGNAPNGAQALQYIGGIAGIASGGSGEAGGTLPGEPEIPVAAPEQEPEAVPGAEAPAEDPNAAPPPVDPASSPYAANLQQLYQSENPELLKLIERQFNQESGNRQFDANGQPVTSSKGAIGIAQVMPKTGPEAAALAGLPWDEDAYRNDPVYNKLLGIAYMSQQLRKYDGDPAKALAAYNAGPDHVDRALSAGGEAYLSLLPAETQDYVQKVL